jgi:plastocyanin
MQEMKNNRAAAGTFAIVLFAGLSGLATGTSSASMLDTPPAPPAAPPAGCDPNAPGSCDSYKKDDPFVDHGDKKVAAKNTVLMSSFAFTPAKITGKPGETWTEDNQDVATHNITTDKLAKKPGKGSGGDIAPDVMPGKKATFKLPKKPGTYKAVCFYHQAMVLTIIVK